MKQPDIHIVISGGGTGGHLFPALAIAEALKKQEPSVKLLFVGALGKLEMEKVPAAGFVIEGLDIMGLQRSFTLQNLRFPIRLIKSLIRSAAIIRQFKPAVAVGVGGYASGPLLYMAARKKIPCLIQEQNSYPGITNKLLASKAARICVAYPGMERFFPASKLLLTGNPVRGAIRVQADHYTSTIAFGLDPEKPVLLVLGGSLGARTLNDCMLAGLDRLTAAGIQVIWQAGKRYYSVLQHQLHGGQNNAGPNADAQDNLRRNIAGENNGEQNSAVQNTDHTSTVRLVEFINDMDQAYGAADLIISRAGAGTIAELAWIAKPVILVPSPNVAEDHQTRNAEALVKTGSALMVTDAAAPVQLVSQVIELMGNPMVKKELSKNIRQHAFPEAAATIAAEILKLATKNRTNHGS